MTNTNDLSSGLSIELALAHQQLHAAQARVQALEAQRNTVVDQTPERAVYDYYILDHLLEGCQIIDFDWRYRYLNDSAARHAQRAKETLLGHTMQERYPGIEKNAMFARLQHCMAERTTATLVNEFINPDGSSAWFELKVVPIPVGLMVLSMDITARKQAEAAERESADWARLALSASNLGKWQHNLETGIIRFDEPARLHYGFAQDTVTLDMVLKQLHPADVQRLGAEIASTLDPANDGRYVTEYRVIHPDGSVHWLAVQAQVYFRGEGATRQPYVGFGTSQEISARKAAEETLKQYTQHLEILHQIDLGIINANSTTAIMTGALKQIRTLFACEQAGALLFDHTTNEIVIMAVEAAAPSLIQEGERYPLSPSFWAEFSTGQVSVIDDLNALPATGAAYQRVRQDGMRSSLRALLTHLGRPLGLLVLNAATPHYFTVEQQSVAAQIANQLAVALQQRQLVDDLAQYVTTVEEMQQFRQAVLDGFPANIAVLAPDGVILTVNQRWQAFAEANGASPDTNYLGVNYLAICDAATGPSATGAAVVAAGIRAVINGEQEEFSWEYPCSTPLARWFLLRVTPFAEAAPRRVIVAHIDITERKAIEKAEHEQRLLAEALRDSLAVLTTSTDIDTTMQQILAYSARVIPSEAGTILIYEGNQGRVAYLRGHSAEAEAFFQTNPIRLDSGLYVAGGADQDYYIVADTKTEPGWRTFPATAWVRSSLAVQIVVRGAPIGLLIVDSATVGRFQPKDVAHLQTFARYAALALEQAQYVNQLEDLVQVRTAELQATKERVEAILHNSADSILLIDPDLQIHQANAAFYRLVGNAPDEAANQTLHNFIAAIDGKAVTQLIQQVIAEVTTGQIEFHGQRHDGTMFAAELSIGAINANGLVCILRDITERKGIEQALLESEARYRFLAENVQDVIVKLSPNGIRMFVTPSCFGLLGYTPDELIGQMGFDIIHPDDRRATEALVQQALTSDQSSFLFVQRVRHKAGHYVWIEATNTVVREPATGKPLEIVGVIRNITERKRVEMLQQARAEEEHEFQQYLRALHEITIELTQIDEITTFYRRIVELGLTYFHIDRLAVFIFDAATGLACGTYGTDPQRQVIAEDHVQFTPAAGGLFQNAFTSPDRFGFHENVPLFYDDKTVGHGWNIATVLWNGAERLGWLVADNLLTQKPATKALLDILRLYALTVGTLLVQKQAQAALRTSEQRYRLLAENISDVVVETTPAAQFLYVSPACRTALGYEPTALIGQNALRYIHPEDLPLAKEAFLATQKANHPTASMSVRFRHQAGYYLWLEILIRAMRTEKTGVIEKYFGSARDISDRKAAEVALKTSEEKYRLLAETMRGGLVVYDVEDRVIYVNDRVCELFGYTPAELVGKRAYELVDFDHVETIKSHFDQRRRLKNSSIELTVKHRNGRAVHLLILGSPLLKKNGDYDGSLVVIVDITAQKQAEETLRLALAKEKELSELKSRFVSMASHEFRTPLATILAITETLNVYRHKLSDDQIQQRLRRIMEQVDHLKDIMEDVLLLAQMQARRAKFNPVATDLDALCRTVLEEFTSHIEIKHRLRYQVSPGDYTIHIDPKLMHQILTNLVSNAIKYSPAEKPVEITLRKAANHCLLQVRDEGIGIPETDLNHLFQPFHRAGNVGAIAGTGLGLVITKEAVELHNGAITVESQLDQGTTFTISLPLTQSALAHTN